VLASLDCKPVGDSITQISTSLFSGRRKSCVS